MRGIGGQASITGLQCADPASAAAISTEGRACRRSGGCQANAGRHHTPPTLLAASHCQRDSTDGFIALGLNAFSSWCSSGLAWHRRLRGRTHSVHADLALCSKALGEKRLFSDPRLVFGRPVRRRGALFLLLFGRAGGLKPCGGRVGSKREVSSHQVRPFQMSRIALWLMP